MVPVSDEKIGLEYKLKRWLEGSRLPPDEAHFFGTARFRRSSEAGHCPSAGAMACAMLAARLGFPAATALERYLRIDQSYYLPDDILYKTDRMSMAHPLEVRPPFLDPRIVDFAAGLPARLKIRGFTQKRVLPAN